MAIDFVDNSYLTDSDSSSYLDGLSACTWMAWIKSDATSTDAGWQIAVNPSGGDTHICARYDSSGFVGGGTNVVKLGLNLTSGQHNRETSSSTQTTDWQHVCGRWSSGSVIQVYLDGVEDTFTGGIAGDGTGTFTGTHQPLNIGRGPKAGNGWNGIVADLRIYNRQLSVNEIQTIYALKGADRIYNGLLVRYAFAESNPGGSIATTSELLKDFGNTGSRHLTRTGSSAPSWVTDILRIGGRRR